MRVKIWVGLSIYILGISLGIAETDKKSEIKKMPSKLHFKAKRHFQDLIHKRIELDGGVEATYGDSTLFAGHVVVDQLSETITATDNVILTIPSETTQVKAHKIVYNYETKLGEFTNAQVKSGFTRIRGKRVTKIGLQKYIVYKGIFTTCDVAEDEACPWKIWTYKAKFELGGYATAEHPLFLVEGFPLFYSPFLGFPVKKERQSGFLSPEMSVTDRSGVGVHNAFFLALGRSHDTTFSLDSFTKRGLKPGFEYRYMVDDLSKGELHGYYIRDREFLKDFKEKNRYAISFLHQYYFRPNLFNKADIKIVSDSQSVKDFDGDMKGLEDAALEAKLFQGWNLDNLSFNVEGIYYQSLVSQFPKDKNNDVTHKLPEFRAVLQPTHFLSDFLNVSFQGSYVNFVSESKDFIDKNNNGRFDPTIDRIKKARRVDIFPEISIPLKYKRFFEFVPTLGYRQTEWWLPVGEAHKRRQIFDIKPILRTTFGRIFGYGEHRITKMKHVIEPSITYHYTPFVRRDSSLPGLDAIDEIDLSHDITWGLENRFIFKVKQDDTYKYFDSIRLGFSQRYDVEIAKGAKSGLPFGPINGVFSVNLPKLRLGTEMDMPVYGSNRFERVATGFEYSDPFQNIYTLKHTYSFKEDFNSMNGSIKLGFMKALKLYAGFNYSFDEDIFLEKIYKVTFFPKTKCWALNAVFRDRLDQGFSFNVNINLLFGENILSLAKLRQEGESSSFNIAPEKADRDNFLF